MGGLGCPRRVGLAMAALGALSLGLACVLHCGHVPDWAGQRLLLGSQCSAFRLADLLSSAAACLTRGIVTYDDAFNWLLGLLYWDKYAGDPLVSVTDAEFDGVRVKIFSPLGRADPTAGFVYIHGGGWTLFSADAYSATTYNLALNTMMVVVSIDYRLAEEQPYPAAFDDCLTATKYFLRNAAQYGVDRERIAIGGDSAGGNLATGVSMKLAQEELLHRPPNSQTARLLPRLKQQVLIYPAVQMLDFNTPSYRAFDATSWLTRRTAVYFWLSYLGFPELHAQWAEFAANNHTPASFWSSAQGAYLSPDNLPALHRLQEHVGGGVGRQAGPGNEALWSRIRERLLDPYFCPLMAEEALLTPLPPAYFVLAQNDIVRDDGLLYAARLRQAGVKVVMDFYDTMAHGFVLLSPIRRLSYDDGFTSLSRMANYLKENL